MPKPHKGEDRDTFVERFMADKAMVEKYPDEKQRYAVAMAHWGKKENEFDEADHPRDEDGKFSGGGGGGKKGSKGASGGGWSKATQADLDDLASSLIEDHWSNGTRPTRDDIEDAIMEDAWDNMSTDIRQTIGLGDDDELTMELAGPYVEKMLPKAVSFVSKQVKEGLVSLRRAHKEARAENTEQSFTSLVCNLHPLVRTETLDGREYLVFPGALITEGVHNGSCGPLYYPADEIQRGALAWNHKPILVQHPQLNGKPASSCDPRVLERQRVGFLLNTEWKGKLRSELWVDKAKLGRVSPEALTRIQANQTMEVSTGLYTTDDPTPGTWNGEDYTAIARNHLPDHLALLPDRRGACSVKDGAGAPRWNQRNEDSEDFVENEFDESQHPRDEDGKFTAGTGGGFDKPDQIQDVLEKAHGSKNVRRIVDAPLDVVFKTPKGHEPFKFEHSTGQWYQNRKQPSLRGPVALDVLRKKQNESVTPTDPTKHNKETAPMDEKLKELEAKIQELTTALATANAEVTKLNEAAKAAKPPTFAELLNAADADTRESIAHGLELVKGRRIELTTAIKANAHNTFTDEELGAMPLPALEKLGAVARPVDYKGQGGSTKITDNAAKPEALPLPSYDAPKK